VKIIHVFVPGKPVPQGSVSVYGGRVVSVKPELRKWRNAIRAALLAKHDGEPLDGPLAVSLVFQMPKPQRPRWSSPAVKPDADKLIRAALDSMSTTKTQRGVITDDARIVSITATKTYHGAPGVMVTITEAGEAA
jgi:Holliday junction resolvase RusA-like endonuclease